MPNTRLPFAFGDPLRTERLLLRLMTVDDVDDVHAYQSREDVCRYLLFEPRTREQVAEKVAWYAAARTFSGDGDFWQLAIERARDPGRVIGDVFFRINSVEHATGEIGWSIHPDFAKQGYMTEAASVLLDLAFDRLGLHRVFAERDPCNHASVAMCKRLGMREEAFFAEAMWFKGAWGDTGVHAILDHEWASR